MKNENVVSRTNIFTLTPAVMLHNSIMVLATIP